MSCCFLCKNNDNHPLFIKTKCTHSFHKTCWDEYMKKKFLSGENFICCPFCNKTLLSCFAVYYQTKKLDYCNTYKLILEGYDEKELPSVATDFFEAILLRIMNEN